LPSTRKAATARALRGTKRKKRGRLKSPRGRRDPPIAELYERRNGIRGLSGLRKPPR